MKKLLLALMMALPACHTIEEPTAHVYCRDCGRDDIMVGDALPVTASWNGRCEYRGMPTKSHDGELHQTTCHTSRSRGEIECQTGCQVEAGPQGPVVRVTAAGDVAFTVRVTNLDSGEVSVSPMQMRVSSPQAIWLQCAAREGDPLRPCGRRPLAGYAPVLAVDAVLGRGTRRMQHVRINGRELQASGEESLFAWRDIAPETIDATGRLRAGVYKVAVEVGGTRGEASIEIR